MTKVPALDFERIFSQFPLPCLILLPDAPRFTIAAANRAYSELTGIEGRDLPGLSFSELYLSRFARMDESLMQAIQKKVPTQSPMQRMVKVSAGGGELPVQYFDSLNIPILNDQKEVEYLIRQITEVTTKYEDLSEMKVMEKALVDTRDQFQSLIQTVEGIFWEADAESLQFSFISDKVESILGYTPEEWLADPDFWKTHIYPADREQAVRFCHREILARRNHTFDYRMIKASGEVIWIRDIVSVISEQDRPRRLRGLMIDITQTKLLTELDALEKNVLELNAKKGVRMREVMEVYLAGLEQMFAGTIFSIMQIKEGKALTWAAPSLPAAYLQAIDHLAIGPKMGSCGTAAYRREVVIVSDIANDPLWTDYKDLVLPFQLRACWSYPILNSAGEVLAVFGIYYHERKGPQEEEIKIIERASALLKVMIEHQQNLAMIKENSLLMLHGQELANFGNWQWSIANNVVTWSDSLYKIYGLEKTEFKATFEGYQDRLHPEDRERVYQHIQNVLITKQDSVFEERIIQPGGQVRHLKSWGRLQVNEQGEPVKMIGACLDITDSKRAELKLQELHEKLEAHLEVLSQSERQYSDLFHLNPQPIWIYEFESLKIIHVNDAALSHYGYSKEEFLRLTIQDIRPEEERGQPVEQLNEERRQQNSKHFGTYRHKKKNGQVILVETHSNAIRFNNKEACIVLARDVTESQKYIQAIENQNVKLQEIAWIQSHVVRAPLAKVLSLIELIRCNDISPEEMADFLVKMEDAAKELDQIIRKISGKSEQIMDQTGLPSGTH